jgi:hypothetical protein
LLLLVALVAWLGRYLALTLAPLRLQDLQDAQRRLNRERALVFGHGLAERAIELLW